MTDLQNLDLERGKFLQQSPDSEWGKSYSGVSWMCVGEPMLPPPGEGPSRGAQTKALDVVVRMRIQTHNENLDMHIKHTQN